MRLDECARSMMDVLHAVLVLNLVRMASIRTFGTSVIAQHEKGYSHSSYISYVYNILTSS